MIIDIEELENLPDREMNLQIDEIIKDIDEGTPVKGVVNVMSNGSSITITGNIEADIVLECDRCLKKFTDHIKLNMDETFVKGKIIEDDKSEVELKSENFIEELGNSNEIDVSDLIYQSIILNIPNKKLCDKNCAGSEEYQQLQNQELVDPRLQVFKDISKKMKE